MNKKSKPNRNYLSNILNNNVNPFFGDNYISLKGRQNITKNVNDTNGRDEEKFEFHFFDDYLRPGPNSSSSSSKSSSSSSPSLSLSPSPTRPSSLSLSPISLSPSLSLSPSPTPSSSLSLSSISLYSRSSPEREARECSIESQGIRTKEKSAELPTEEEDERINYYPNCDPRVWLRTCSNPIEEPLTGIQIGVIPKWLNGSLIRNGPGRMKVGNDTYNHIFDGSALLHRFHFKDGRVTYMNKFLKSSSYLKDTEAQRIVVNYFGTRGHPDPCKTILQNIASKFSFEEHFSDNAQISVYPYGDGLYALTETPYLFRIDPDTLNTEEKIDMTKYLTIFSHTAHPHVSNHECVFNIGQGVNLYGPVYHVCEFPANSPFSKAKIVGSVNARWKLNPCYMHSFGLTKNYFVIIEQPLVMSTKKVIKGIIFEDSLIHSLQWWDRETKFHVIDRRSGKALKLQYETEAFFFLHVVNAFEENGCIVIDICAYKDAKMLDCMFTEALKDASYDPSYAQMFRGRPKRWILPLNPGTMSKDPKSAIALLPGSQCTAKWIKKDRIYVEPELLANIGCEVPRINYEIYNGKKYRYFYAICSDVDHPRPGTLIKVDTIEKSHLEWSEDNIYPSEPVFIPKPNAQKEDDGVLVSSLLRCKGLDGQICLVVLDASSFREMGRVEFQCMGQVPKCLHGWFVQEGTLTGSHSVKCKEKKKKND